MIVERNKVTVYYFQCFFIWILSASNFDIMSIQSIRFFLVDLGERMSIECNMSLKYISYIYAENLSMFYLYHITQHIRHMKNAMKRKFLTVHLTMLASMFFADAFT